MTAKKDKPVARGAVDARVVDCTEQKRSALVPVKGIEQEVT